MIDIGRMLDLLDDGELVVWELRRGSEVLGTLTANGWVYDPWIGADFVPSQDFENYRPLFDEYNRTPIKSTQYSIRLDAINRRNELMKQIVALNLTISPLNENALPGAVEKIVIPDSMEAQLIVDFEEPTDTPG